MNYYVYVLLDPCIEGDFVYEELTFKNEPFYVGFGKNKRSSFHTNHVKKLIKNSLKIKGLKNIKIAKILKSGNEPIIRYLNENLILEKAWVLEKQYIAQIGRIIKKEGPLTNIMDGGNCFPESVYDYNVRVHPMLGKKRSDETCLAISRGLKGVKFSEEHNIKISIALKGKTQSQETKDKRNSKLKGRICSEDTILKIKRAARHRKQITVETRNLMSESAKKKELKYIFIKDDTEKYVCEGKSEAKAFCRLHSINTKIVFYKKRRGEEINGWKCKTEKI